MSKQLKLILKALVTVGAFAILIWKIDWHQTFDLLEKTKWGYFIIVVGLAFVGTSLNALRWDVLLKALGIKIKLGSLYIFCLVGKFFNSFMPTTVGGDVYRIAVLKQRTNKLTDSFLATILGRIIGVLVLVAIAILSALITWNQEEGQILRVIVLCVGGLIYVMFGLMFVSGIYRFFERIASYLKLKKIAKVFPELLRGMKIVQENKLAVLQCFVISLANQLLSVLFYYLLAVSIGLNISFITLFLVVPIVTLIAMIPISLNGYGIKQGALVFLLGIYGYPSDESMSLALLALFSTLLISFIGGLFYIAFPQFKEKDA